MNSGAEHENHSEDLATRAKKFSLNPGQVVYHRQKTISSKNQFKIVKSLAYNYSSGNGRTIHELAKDTDLSESTILTQGRLLIKSGLVTKIGGKFGKYYLSQIALGGPQLEGKLFASKGLGKILPDYQSIPIINKFINISPENTSIEEVELFMFINRIGAYVAYILTEALRTNKFQLIISNNAKRKKNTFGSGRDRDNLVKAWVKATINPDLILWEFSNLKIVGRGLRRNEEEDYELENPLWSFYEMNDKTIFEGLRKVTCNSLS